MLVLYNLGTMDSTRPFEIISYCAYIRGASGISHFNYLTFLDISTFRGSRKVCSIASLMTLANEYYIMVGEVLTIQKSLSKVHQIRPINN